MQARHLKWQRRALSVAVLVSWASSTQLVGCLNNAPRSDLAAEAGRAALSAEEGQSDRRPESIASASKSKPLPGNVVVAGGEIPEQPGPIVQTGGESSAQKPSFWNFWSSKPEKPAVDDPFANAPAPKNQAESRNDADSPQSVAAKVRMASSAADSGAVDKPAANESSPEQWFENEFRRTSPLSSWEREAVASSNAAALQPEDSGSKIKLKNTATSQPDSFPPSRSLNREEASSKAAVANSPFDDVTAESAPWAAQRPTSTANSASAATLGYRQLADSVMASQSKHANSSAERLGKDASAAGNAKRPTPEPIHIRKEKLRIQALLSDAHTNQMRGELHAAYRSALLAEKVAKEHRIEFAQDEENPSDLARTIAASIWRTSNTSEEAYLAASEVTAKQKPTPVAVPEVQKTQESAPVNSPFDDHLFATWRPLPDSLDQRPERMGVESLKTPATSPSLSQTHSSALSQSPPPRLDILPEIRPSNPGKEASRKSPLQGSNPPRELGMTAPELPGQEEARKSASESGGKAVDSGVQFAIAQSVSEPAPFNSPFTGSETRPDAHGISDDQSLAATFGQRRPVLMAPPVPMDMTQAHVEPSPLSWEEADQASRELSTATTSNADTSSRWRMTWALLGLFGAVVTGVIGYRISRREEEFEGESQHHANASGLPTTVSMTTPIESNVSTTPDAENAEPEVQAIQFKRAA